jgi:DNA-binding response OmpR family regulator
MLDCGMDAHLAKPFDVKELVSLSVVYVGNGLGL